jgi:trimeric autotransporter adhesin
MRCWCCLIVTFVAGSLAVAQPTPLWSDQFAYGGLDAGARAAVAFDEDGAGPAESVLIVAGGFSKAGGLPASRIARWDGTAWSEVGGGLDANSFVYDLQVYDEDGAGPKAAALFVAGSFETAGGQAIPTLARWDGQSWSAVGFAPDGGVIALCLYDPDGAGPKGTLLCAGGQFASIGGVPASGVATWDGSKWSALGKGLIGSVESLCVVDHGGAPVLVTGGSITKAGDTPVKNVASWNGSGWSALGKGLSDFGGSCNVYRLAAYDEDGDGPDAARVFAAGTFEESDGVPLDGFARWNGVTWSAVGDDKDVQVDEMSVLDPDGAGPDQELLVVGGSVDLDNDGIAERIAAWDGEGWSAFGNHLNEAARVLRFDPDGDGPVSPDLIAAGAFRNFSECISDGVARLDGQDWVPLGGGANWAVYGLQPFDHDGDPQTPRRLVAVGNFRGIGGRRTDFVSAWDGQRWEPMNGLNSTVLAVTSADLDGDGPGVEELFVGGWFEKAGGQPMWRVARWTGNSWAALGPGCTNVVYALSSLDLDGDGPATPGLYVGGSFYQLMNGLEVAFIAMWDGQDWHKLGKGLSSGMMTMAPLSDGSTPLGTRSMFVGGSFTKAGDTPSPHVARWDGENWEAVGGGVNDAVYALALYDEDGPGPLPMCLFVGGEFTKAGGQEIPYLARWDGQEWTGVSGGVDFWVYALGVHDPDGPGPRRSVLVVGGEFDHAGGIKASGVAAWDGHAWSALGDGLSGGWALSFAQLDDLGGGEPAPGLFVGGEFKTAGGKSAGYISRYGFDEVPCYADLNGDGSLSLFDFLAFINLFNDGDPDADCDADGTFTLFDFLCFVNLFNGGC